MRDKLAALVCKATQKTNYKCDSICDKKGSCAYCLVIAEELLTGGAVVQEDTESDHIEPAPVVHGRWIANCICSVCRKELTEWAAQNGYNYCPACGAKMDQE